MRQPTILAMGGGGFTMEPDNPALDELALELTERREPRVLFLPTASGDPAGQIQAFYDRFGGRACRAQHLSLFRRHGDLRSLAEIVCDQDLIYVGGGSMRNLLAIWRAHRLDTLLVSAWRRGTVLAGLSAGAMCWFEGGITKSAGPPEPIAGIGVLRGSLTVHADGEPDRLPVWLRSVGRGELPGGWALDDGVGLVYRGTELARVVSSRPGGGALRCDAVGGELVRRHAQTELLELTAPRALDEDVRELRETLRRRR